MTGADAYRLAVAGGRRGRLCAGCLQRSRSFPMRTFVAAVGAVTLAGLAGCASYNALPLPRQPDLATSLAGLKTVIPAAGTGYPTRKINIKRPLTIDQIGVLAILNDPDLKSERGTIDVARAALLQTTLLPNPVASAGYGALISGPGSTSSISASLAQDIRAIVIQGAQVEAAKAQVYDVDAGQLWREWQVAQKARQLAVDIYSAAMSINLTNREQQLLLQELEKVKKAIAAGNLTLAAQAPLSAAVATAEQLLVTLRLDRLKNWQALDGLLGLYPNVRFEIAQPALKPLPKHLKLLIADLPERPDLAALRFGYRSAEEDVRAAILGQFPALTLGPMYSRDTSRIVSAGPAFTLGLPVFDRNQGQIAKTEATRLLLRAQYQARFDSAVANIKALVAQLDQLSADLVVARKAAAAAQSLAATARQAYVQNNLDQRTFTDYETTALERALQVVIIERQINEDKIFLAVELGLGLPRIPLGERTPCEAELCRPCFLNLHHAPGSWTGCEGPRG